ncbi:peptide chain release factor N(5)-glutamine methyltransferase [Buchnera aphidicola]|uniref:peptide chain release factor N(5)-glutamine methyltransferase n=1 Tax=Buchnera aphidicola TaxID=9 RepID=UPI0031B7F00C
MSIIDWLNYAYCRLSYIGYLKIDAELILKFVLKRSKIWLIINHKLKLNILQLNQLNQLLNRRISGEPIAYLLRKKEFWSLSLCISKFVLIPRTDTEILVEQSLKRITHVNFKILDLGTGSGAIALAIAKTRPDCHILGIDCLKESVELATFNAKKLNLNNINFIRSNWFSELNNKKFNIIVSNPPYIGLQEISLLDKDIFFEPFISLVSGNDGLADIQFIVKNANKYLYSQGYLLIEHSYRQKNVVQNIFKSHGFLGVKSYKDYSGNDRITLGKKI